MRVGAATATGAAPKVLLGFELAPGTALRFLEDTLRVEDGAGSRRVPVRMSVASHARVAPGDTVDLVALSAVAPAALDAAGPGAVSITVGTGFSPGAAASIQVPLGGAAIERYRLGLPPLEVNGRRLQPETIELERRTMDGGLEPFNC